MERGHLIALGHASITRARYHVLVSAPRFASVLALGVWVGCQVHDIDYRDKACPCPEPEWVCHAETQRCVKSAEISSTTGSCGTQSTGTTIAEFGDSFDRPDERPLSGCGLWTGGFVNDLDTFPVTTPFELVAGSVRGTSLQADSVMAFTVPLPANHFIEVRLKEFNDTGMDTVPGVLVRLQPSTQLAGYECRIKGRLESRIARWSEPGSKLAVKADVIWEAGDILRCEAEGKQVRMLQIRGGEQTLIATANDAKYSEGSTGLISFTRVDVADTIFDDVRVGEIKPP